MMQAFLRPLFAGVTALSAGAGYLYWERDGLCASTHAAAEAERATAAQQAFVLSEEIKKLRIAEAQQQSFLDDKMGTVEALWNERDRRIQSETRRAADGIYAMPEVFSIINGIAAHSRDHSEKLPMFYEEFDLNASKLHTIGALLSNLIYSSETDTSSKNATVAAAAAKQQKKRRSLRDIAPALSMFRSDPMLGAINLLLQAEDKLSLSTAVAGHNGNTPSHLRPATDDDSRDALPGSTQELSETFCHLMQHFQLACAGAMELTATPNNSNNNNNKNHRNKKKQKKALLQEDPVLLGQDDDGTAVVEGTDEQIHDQEHRLGFVVQRVVPKLAESAHMMTTIEHDAMVLQDEQERAKREAVLSSWRLYTDEDVFAAVNYVTKTHRDIVDAAASGERWALHPFVAPAIRNLTVWAVGAEQHLAEVQTRHVIRDITRCTSHNFIQVKQEAKKRMPPAAAMG